MIGKRALKKSKPFELKDRVEVMDDETGGWRPGKIVNFIDGQIKIRLDPEEGQEEGRKIKVYSNSLRYQQCTGNNCASVATKIDGLCDKCRLPVDDEPEEEPQDDKKGGREQKGFNTSGIKWDEQKVNFKFTVNNGVRFYGWWRKTRLRNSGDVGYAIDIFAIRTEGENKDREFSVESIYYADRDPRINLKSLNADICAAGNKWFFQTMGGSAKNTDTLLKRAEQPTIKINRIETIDRLIMKLQEYRSVALRAGGQRIVELVGDREGDPKLVVILNLSAQAFALEGKVPPIAKGATYDIALTNGKGGEVVGRHTPNVPDKASIEVLTAQLKAASNPVEARQIRGILRKMGHKGGVRGVK